MFQAMNKFLTSFCKNHVSQHHFSSFVPGKLEKKSYKIVC